VINIESISKMVLEMHDNFNLAGEMKSIDLVVTDYKLFFESDTTKEQLNEVVQELKGLLMQEFNTYLK